MMIGSLDQFTTMRLVLSSAFSSLLSRVRMRAAKLAELTRRNLASLARLRQR